MGKEDHPGGGFSDWNGAAGEKHHREVRGAVGQDPPPETRACGGHAGGGAGGQEGFREGGGQIGPQNETSNRNWKLVGFSSAALKVANYTYPPGVHTDSMI